MSFYTTTCFIIKAYRKYGQEKITRREVIDAIRTIMRESDRSFDEGEDLALDVGYIHYPSEFSLGLDQYVSHGVGQKPHMAQGIMFYESFILVAGEFNGFNFWNACIFAERLSKMLRTTIIVNCPYDEDNPMGQSQCYFCGYPLFIDVNKDGCSPNYIENPIVKEYFYDLKQSENLEKIEH